MSTDIQPTAYSNEQLELIKQTVAKGATTNELQLFLHRCKILGLDPLKPGQIHFVKYSGGAGTIVVGIDGFRTIAHRSGKLSGISRGVTKDKEGYVVSGWAEVHRSDWTHPAREEVPFAEYNTAKGPWAKMPETMIKKVAECAALRMAFSELGGVYAPEEMDQASNPMSMSSLNTEIDSDPHLKVLSDNAVAGEYRIDFGKFAKRSIEEVIANEGPQALESYVLHLESKAEKDGKPIDPKSKAGIFIEKAVLAVNKFYDSLNGAVNQANSNDDPTVWLKQ